MGVVRRFPRNGEVNMLFYLAGVLVGWLLRSRVQVNA